METEAIPADPGDARYGDPLCRDARALVMTEDVSRTIERENFPGGDRNYCFAVQLAGGLAVQRADCVCIRLELLFPKFHNGHGDSRHAADWVPTDVAPAG